MEQIEIEERLEKLERTVESLRQATEPVTRSTRLMKFLVSNWVLASFLAALLTAVYVKARFGVDYFRDYRNIQAKNQLSAFYTHMGDVLMGRSEWPAAEEAYKHALEIDPEDTAATLGVVKTGMFKPEEGTKYYAGEVADAKLSYLLALYPDDDQLMFLKGVRLEDEGEVDQAVSWYQKAIKQNPRAFGSYFQIGFLDTAYGHSDIDDAVKNFKLASELDPDFPELDENLGYLYMLMLNLPEAQKYLRDGYVISPSWEKESSLADCLRLEGNFRDAVFYHRDTLKQLEEAAPKDRYLGGQSNWNYLPLTAGDRQSLKNMVTTYTPEQKKAFVHYELSLDYGMMGNFAEAEKERVAALQLDKEHEYPAYFSEASDALSRLVHVDQAEQDWLKRNQATLLSLAAE